MSLLLGAAAALAVHGLLVVGPWPWRVAELLAPPPAGGAGRAARPGRRRRGPGTSRWWPLRGPVPGTGRGDGTVADLPACADLLVVAALAGHTPSTALAAVVEAAGPADGPATRALAEAHDRHRRGADLVVAVDVLVERLGPAARPLAAALQGAHLTGTSLAGPLQRFADAERRRARRRAEARVRRLPVLLLLPLVAFVLPAFVLVTLVPVGVATARSAPIALPLPPTSRGAPS